MKRAPLAIVTMLLTASAGAWGQSTPTIGGIALPPLISVARLVGTDPSGAAGTLNPAVASQSLRLTLVSTIFPLGSQFPNCATRMEASGNSIAGFPIQRMESLQLTPQLTLTGFTQGGCPVDAGIGGGVTYTVPLQRSLWLVASAGVYRTPFAFATNAGVNLVKQTSKGRSLSVGLQRRTGHGSEGVPAIVTFGGAF